MSKNISVYTLTAQAWDDKIHRVLDVVEGFVSESKFKLTYNFDNAYKYMWGIVNDPNSDVIIAEDCHSNVVGGAIVSCEKDVCDETMGYIVKFYISPSKRGIGAGRSVSEKICSWFEKKEAVFSFATSTAMIGNDKVFTNLLSKYGYRDIGPTLCKNHGEING